MGGFFVCNFNIHDLKIKKVNVIYYTVLTKITI